MIDINETLSEDTFRLATDLHALIETRCKESPQVNAENAIEIMLAKFLHQKHALKSEHVSPALRLAQMALNVCDLLWKIKVGN